MAAVAVVQRSLFQWGCEMARDIPIMDTSYGRRRWNHGRACRRNLIDCVGRNDGRRVCRDIVYLSTLNCWVDLFILHDFRFFRFHSAGTGRGGSTKTLQKMIFHCEPIPIHTHTHTMRYRMVAMRSFKHMTRCHSRLY